jgi:hypothetical protein
VVRSRGGPDAGFANPEVYELLEAERFKYAIRLRQTGRIGYLLKRPVGFIVTAPLLRSFNVPGRGSPPRDACHRLIRLWAQGLLPDT